MTASLCSGGAWASRIRGGDEGEMIMITGEVTMIISFPSSASNLTEGHPCPSTPRISFPL